MSESSLINFQALRTATLLKRDSTPTQVFSCEISEIFKNTLFYKTSPVVASDSFRFPACNSIKKGTPATMFFCKFWKIFKNIFLFIEHLRIIASCIYLWILRSFSEHFFYKAPLGSCLFHVRVAEFQPLDTLKNISEVFFKHFIKEQEVTIPRRSFT